MGLTMKQNPQERGSKQEDRSSVARSVLFMQALLEYGPFAIAAILLLLTSLSDVVPRLESVLPASRVGLYVCVAFLAFFPFVLRLTDRVGQLSQIVLANTATQERFIGTVGQSTSRVSLGHAFRIAEDVVGHCHTIRVFAFTSKYISQHMQSREFSTEQLRLLIGDTDPNVDELLDSEVRLSVLYTWAGRVRVGAIKHLVVHQYDFYPSEWFVIFDDRLMIMSTYVYDEHQIGRARTSLSAFVVRAGDEGSKLIEAKSETFDALYEASERNLGGGSHEGVYEMVSGRLRRRHFGGESWEDVDPVGHIVLPPSEN
jgi:hypothetical protein